MISQNMEREKEWGRKRDFEIIVKNELAESILDVLVKEVVSDLDTIQTKRMRF